MTKSDQTTIRDILDWAERYADAQRDAIEAMDDMQRSGQPCRARYYMWAHFQAIFYKLEETSYKMAANAMRNRDAEWLDELSDIMRRMEAATIVLEGERESERELEGAGDQARARRFGAHHDQR